MKLPIRIASVVTLLLLSFYSLEAATIKGLVTDKISGEPLIGAVVVLEGTRYGTITGLDGSYKIPNVPAGNYEVKVKYTSYAEYEKKITVTQDETIVINPAVASKYAEMHEVQITAKHENGSDEQARNKEKNADEIMNIMSARTIELLPDITVANVLQRVSGVQMQRDANGEGRYAIIRGMDKRYNYTTVNGIKIPSPDDKARYVPMDIFPAEILDRVEVIKSWTPSMEGDAVGGVMNIVMKDAPDHLVLYASAATGYNQTLFDRSYAKFDKNAIASQDPAAINGLNYKAKVTDFGVGNLNPKNIQAPPNDLFSLTIGNRFLKSKKLGVIFSGSYQNTFKGTNTLFFKPAAEPSVYNVPQFDDIELRKYSTQETRIGLHTKIDYQLNDRNLITLYGLYLRLDQQENRDYIDTTASGENRNGPGLGPITLKDRTAFRKQAIKNLTLQGKHRLADNLIIDWSGALSQANADVPDLSQLSVATNTVLDSAHQIHQTNTLFTSISHTWESTRDQDIQGFLNITYTPRLLNKKIEFKGGGMYRHKERSNYYNDYTIKPATAANGIPFTTITNIADTSLRVDNPQGVLPYNWLYYNVTENIYAYYLQAKIYFFNEKLEVLGGARVENTYQNYSVHQDSNIGGIKGTFKYMDVLPSIHFKYALNNNTSLRLSYFESISRPGFFEVVPYEFHGEDFDEYGNYQLHHSIAQNLDLRYELFPKGNDQVLIGAFYKNIQNPIEYLIVRASGPSAQQIQSRNLANAANNYGAEIVLTKYIHYFGISANYTYTHSAINDSALYLIPNTTGGGFNKSGVLRTRPLQGQAAHIANLSFIYKNPVKGIDAQISWAYTGRYIALLSGYNNLDYWQRATSFIDFSCEKRIAKHISIYAKVNNILNTPVIWEMLTDKSIYLKGNKFYLPYQSLPNSTLVKKSTYGTNYLVGIRFKLN
ncbi:MAG: carboxypeptidase-like regulatory domain-containing protein [Taibaiella sp.]|nr:carboxypeptidase-like regulatory domain-containing protein [Taibaiella sp.]